MTNPQLTTAKDFFDILFTTYFQSHDGYVEIRLVPPKDSSLPTFSRWLRRGELSEQEGVEIARLIESHHAYFGVNPRPLSKEKTQDAIKDVVCLWADVDGKDFDGLKAEAWDRVKAFPLAPTLVVDSGHGYHCYWILKEPITNLEDEQRTAFKQLLAGAIKTIGGDKSKLHLDTCLRLPGTFNIKESPVLEVAIIEANDATYRLEDFLQFRDTEYAEPEAAPAELPAFGTRTKVISTMDEKAAHADVAKLEVPSKTKNLILTGAMLRAKDADHSRSGRDFSIICSLIYWGYDYATIKSIFFNPKLKCGNRIREEGEKALLWDVGQALKKVQSRKTEVNPKAAAIAAIRADHTLSFDEKLQAIGAFIVNDLLRGPEAAGDGFRNSDRETFYFFDRAEKMLMPLEGTDFYCYMRERFGLAKKDFEEMKDAVMTAIWDSGKVVTPRRFAYWDASRRALYISNGANGIYKLDGKEITLYDNSEDGVFFEQDPALAPFTFNPEGAVNYFTTPVEETLVTLPGDDGDMVTPAGWKFGLNWNRFNQDDVLLKRFLTDWASFESTTENPLTPDEQKLLLVIYSYSLFFESALRDKPIVCFVGTMESGKSTLAKLIGKLLFGDAFDIGSVPKTADDLAITLGGSYYTVMDNMDSHIKGNIADMICSAATGVIAQKRELFTDSTIVRVPVHSFLAITSRDPRFKTSREDLVARLLLFNTKKVESVVGPTELFGPLLAGRDAALSEVLVNLNSIVVGLGAAAHRPSAPMVSRHMTDWEAFGMTVMGGWSRAALRSVMHKLNEKKGRFAIEDSDQYLLLYSMTFERGWALDRLTAGELYLAMEDEARELKIKDFSRHCPHSKRLAGWIKANLEALEQEFEIVITDDDIRSRQRSYSIKARGLPIEPKVVDAEWLERMRNERERTRRAR